MSRYVDNFRVEYMWNGEAICSYFTTLEKAKGFISRYMKRSPETHMVIKRSVIEWKSIV